MVSPIPPPAPRRPEPQKVNHLLHFFLGVFTFGLWWIMWLFIAISAGWQDEKAQSVFRRDYERWVQDYGQWANEYHAHYGVPPTPPVVAY